MKTVFASIGLTFALAAPAMAADTVYGTPNAMRLIAPYAAMVEGKGGVKLEQSSLGTGQLVLDVLDGKTSVAVVAAAPKDAIAAAREAAWAEGRMLRVPESLQFLDVPRLAQPGQPLVFVSLPDSAPKRLVEVMELR